MLILPYSTELRLPQIPYVTIAIIVLCLIIHYFQDLNRAQVKSAVNSYCASIHDEASQDDVSNLRRNQEDCRFVMDGIHFVPDKERLFRSLKEYYAEETEFTDGEFEVIISDIKGHYARFSENAPRSLEQKLLYDPAILNPIRMVTSTLSHGDWWHIVGNLIFFIAFTPILEALVGSFLRFIGVILLIALVTHVSYSITSYSSGEFIPTLGLSGVVMGMIGFSAYMMPKAKIRTLVWFIYFFKVVPIPAWVLAVWYVGWDTYDLFSRTDNGDINLVAHVSGGISGYLIGVAWFKARREEYQRELSEEIEYTKCKRQDRLGILSSTVLGQDRLMDEWREHSAKKDYLDYLGRVNQLIKTRQDSEAIVLMLQNYDLYCQSVNIYEEHFHELKHNRAGRAFFCLGRLVIRLLIQQKLYARAIVTAKMCVEKDDGFVLADPADLAILVRSALNQQDYNLAYQLITNIEMRYGKMLDSIQYRILETKLLWRYLNKSDEAQHILEKLLTSAVPQHVAEIQKLAGNMGLVNSKYESIAAGKEAFKVWRPGQCEIEL